jgi:hypothetical protein
VVFEPGISDFQPINMAIKICLKIPSKTEMQLGYSQAFHTITCRQFQSKGHSHVTIDCTGELNGLPCDQLFFVIYKAGREPKPYW